MSKTFYLGVGAQKAGTTWLYRYLERYPNFNFGFIKEYHIWDTKYINGWRNFSLTTVADFFRRKSLPSRLSRKAFHCLKLQWIPGAYERYFSSLLINNVDSTGDITPAYAGLNTRQLRVIKERLEAAGFNIKVIFLMRDPFERCWSAARMVKIKCKLSQSDQQVLKERFKSYAFEYRTEYHKTICALDAVFSKEQIYYGVYEEMFTAEKITEFSRFCGVVPDTSFAEKSVNVSPKTENLPDELRRDVINYYSDVYDFCEKRFPQTKVLWSRR